MNALPESSAPWRRAENRKRNALIAAGTSGVVLAFCLMALPVAWYIGVYGVDGGKRGVVENELLELIALDSRWEREALQALSDLAPAPSANHAAAAAGITQRLEAAARGSRSAVLRRGVPNLIRAYAEKAQLMGRFHLAHAAALGALRQALAAEAEFAGLLRDVWHDAPDRQRLVAADNLVTRLVADAQRYYFVPAGSHRKDLETSAGDLHGAAAGLPEALKPVAARLESHIGDLLRARPQQQLHLDRMRFHDAGPLAATLARELRDELAAVLERQQRYRVYLAAYFCVLLVLVAYLAARLIQRRLATSSRAAASATPAVEPGPTEPGRPPAAGDRAGP